MAEPIGFYTAKRRPSGPPPRQFSYQDHFHSQPNINYDPHGWHDPNQRAWTPEAIPNGNTRRVPLNRLKSQDPPHQEPIWPGTAPADDPFDYRFTPVVVEAPVTLTQAPVESAYPKPQQNRNSEPDMPRNYYPDERYINPPNKRYANPPDDRYINPQNNRYANPPDDRYINPPNNRYASPPDDRYINPPDPRVRRAQTPDNLDNDNRMRRARTPDNLDNDSGYYAPQPQKQYRRPKTPDDLDGPAYPRDRYDRARTPDALGDRVYPPRQVNPDRARRAATPDNLDGRPPRAPPMDQQRRAHTIDNSRPPRHPDNRYKRASTPDMLDDKPRYHTLDNRPPLVRQTASTPEPRYPDNRQPLATRPDPYQRANTPDDLNGYPKSPRPDYTNRKQSLQPPTPRMQRAPSVEPYYELDPYGHALSTDNLDDVWGQMMQGNQDYENFDFATSQKKPKDAAAMRRSQNDLS